MPAALIAIDQGTTSTRAIVFDAELRPLATAQQELRQIYPAPGEVEHDPEEIWSAVVATVRAAMKQARIGAKDVAGIGITNQRETVVIWDRQSGRPIHNAIVWQDRRTADHCEALRRDGHEPDIARKTGLLIDPYFSASKIAWLLDRIEGARAAAEAGKLAFGTIDTFLLWRLTGGKSHLTDATNAARTLLFDIGKGTWDADLCRLFKVPTALLPEVRDCAGIFGETEAGLFGGPIHIRGIAGDQQAATIGQGCFEPGMVKSTYGTGCFALLNTGPERLASRNRLLTTIAYQLEGQRTYALEGAIFIAGAAVQWLRDALKIIASAPEVGPLAQRADPAEQVYLVPAFVGLGAPYWDAQARGAILRPDAQFRRRRVGKGRARIRRLSDPRPSGSHACRLANVTCQNRIARRWRDDRERPVHAVPLRHPRMSGRSADGAGNDGHRCCISRRPRRRNLRRPCRIRKAVAARPPLRAAHGCERARAKVCGLEAGGAANLDRGKLTSG